MTRGEYESAADIERVVEGFCIKGVNSGFLKENEDKQGEEGDSAYEDEEQATRKEKKKWHFYIQDFIHVRRPKPKDMNPLVERLANFHNKSAEKFENLTANHRPQGTDFGYHTTTHNGKLAQDNRRISTREYYFTRNMYKLLDHDTKKGGPRPLEMEELLRPFFCNVTPRLLRPMERYRRKISPSRCHGDVWEGNVGVGEGGVVVVFDPGCFWGHGECMMFVPRRCTRGRS